MSGPFLAEAARALGWALLHFLWQGCAIAAVLAGVRLALPVGAARLRYLAGCTALAAMLAAFVATFALLGEGTHATSGAAAGSTAAAEAIAPGLADAPPAATADRSEAGRAAPLWQSARDWLEPAIPWVLAAWLAGVCLLSLRLAGGWTRARRIAVRGCEDPSPHWLASLARLREALAVSRPVRLAASAVAEVPSVVGWLRPVVVIPAYVFAGMTPWQVEAILAHEMAHVSRHDYLVNLLQSAVETLLFYHPATWWVSRQVREERERCCDDVAVALCGDAAGYVRALAELEGMRATPALAMSATGGSLLGRARRLLAPADTRRSSATVAAAVAVALLVFAWASASAERAAGNAVSPGAIIASFPEAAVAQPGAPAPKAFTAPLRLSPPAPPPAHLPPPRASQPRRRAPERRIASPRPPAEGPDLIDQMAALGYARVPVDDLIALGTHGVTGAYVRAMNGLGFGRLRVDTVLSLKIHGVTPAYARELRAAGVAIARADELQAMKIHGVTPAFVREAKRLGHRPLSPDRLVSLRIHGLIPERSSP